MGTTTDSTAGSDNIDPAELKRRTEFLKAQRDKLLALKKAEREKQLAEAEKAVAKARPKSARAARSAMGGRGGGQAGQKIDPELLKARRALAAKLKQEVIGNEEEEWLSRVFSVSVSQNFPSTIPSIF